MMLQPRMDGFAATAVAAVELAMDHLKRLRGEFRGQSAGKSDNTPVTVLDYVLQAIIGRHLQTCSPLVPMFGEERSEMLFQPEHRELLRQVLDELRRIDPTRFVDREELIRWLNPQIPADGYRLYWSVDPIDGTAGLIDDGTCAIVLGLVRRAIGVQMPPAAPEIRLVVIACPTLQADGIGDHGPGTILLVDGREFSERPGGPTELPTIRAWYRPVVQPGTSSEAWEPAQVSTRTTLEGAHIVHSANHRTVNRPWFAALGRVLPASAILAPHHSALKFMLVALGLADGYVRFPAPDRQVLTVNPWDLALGAHAVRLAGGRVTDFFGSDFALLSPETTLPTIYGMIASNGRLDNALRLAVDQARETLT